VPGLRSFVRFSDYASISSCLEERSATGPEQLHGLDAALAAHVAAELLSASEKIFGPLRSRDGRSALRALCAHVGGQHRAC